MVLPFSYGYMNMGLLSGIYGASITALAMTTIWTRLAYNDMRDRHCLVTALLKRERTERGE